MNPIELIFPAVLGLTRMPVYPAPKPPALAGAAPAVRVPAVNAGCLATGPGGGSSAADGPSSGGDDGRARTAARKCVQGVGGFLK